MKTTTLKMPKELKEDVEPVKKIMYGHDENIKKWHTGDCSSNVQSRQKI
jgi:hypothetical protein